MRLDQPERVGGLTTAIAAVPSPHVTKIDPPGATEAAVEDFLRENWTKIVGVLGVLALIWLVAKVLSPKKTVIGEGMKLNVRCRTCGWQGTVTKYNRTCSGCNGTDLQQF